MPDFLRKLLLRNQRTLLILNEDDVEHFGYKRIAAYNNKSHVVIALRISSERPTEVTNSQLDGLEIHTQFDQVEDLISQMHHWEDPKPEVIRISKSFLNAKKMEDSIRRAFPKTPIVVEVYDFLNTRFSTEQQML